jgi:hypothetical protein
MRLDRESVVTSASESYYKTNEYRFTVCSETEAFNKKFKSKFNL